MILEGVSWTTYESLLADHEERPSPRFTYDRGKLEIMTTSSDHERDKCALAQLVLVVAEEMGVEILPMGSMTFKRADLQQGFEPDACFYIQHEAQVRNVSQIDPTKDPPPDLVIEIDVTHSSLTRFPIYAGFQVPEIWRLSKGRVYLSRLKGNGYRSTSTSQALPPLTSDVLTRFLAQSRILARNAWVQSIRAWIREHATVPES
jgi:Uma2 family endonuclease